jgi:prophage regulatory protein
MNTCSTAKTVDKPESFYRLPDVLKIIPVSRSRWWLGVRTGEYPAPCKLSARCTAWSASSIQNLVHRLANGAEK